MTSINDLTEQLEKHHVEDDENGVLSYSGRSLKLNTESDAKVIKDDLCECKNLSTFNLDGNTIGIEAAKEIGVGLQNHPEFKNAIWKNMFTGRTKEEIPVALRHMCDGIILANAKLVTLDLSDNAFGPIGVDGLTKLLASESCHTLKELRLNNNGLGIHGGKMLAKELLNCFKNSNGKFTLTTFIAGRNRLENLGAKALADVFKAMGSLETICLPQNGIYYQGITALSDAFKCNPNLKEINLNDNTLNIKGAKAVADVLPFLHHLEILNIGDCLLKTKGALLISEGIALSKANLKNLILDENEISINGILSIVHSVCAQRELKILSLSGNYFGSNGLTEVKDVLKASQQENILGYISDEEDEYENTDDENEEDKEESDEDGKSDEDYDDQTSDESHDISNKNINDQSQENEKFTDVLEFLSSKSTSKFIDLGANKSELLIRYLQNCPGTEYPKKAVELLVNVSGFCNDKDEQIAKSSLTTSVQLYKYIFSKTSEDNELQHVMNSILTELQLIKAEDKYLIAPLKSAAAVIALKEALYKSIIPEPFANIMKFLINNKNK